MRICHYSNAAVLPGGTATYVLALLNAQRAAGHEVALYLKAVPNPLPALGFRTVTIRDESDLYLNIEKDRGDILHLHENVTTMPAPHLPVVFTSHGHGFVCLSASLFLKTSRQPCPHVYSPSVCLSNHVKEHCGSVRPTKLAREFLRLRNERKNLPLMDVIVPSTYFYNAYLDAGFPSENLHLVPHFCDASPARIRKKSFQSTDGPPRFLFTGRVEMNRGVADLIYAMRLVPEAQLDIAGKGTYLSAAIKLTHKLGLERRVNFHGWLDKANILKLYAESIAVLMPSLTHETFGLSAAEAQSHGLAVIASSVGGLEDIVQHGITGLLHPPGDVIAIANAMKRMIHEPTWTYQLGSNGAKRMREMFSLTKHLHLIETVYRHTISHQNRATKVTLAVRDS